LLRAGKLGINEGFAQARQYHEATVSLIITGSGNPSGG
jgi:hypothetical protein